MRHTRRQAFSLIELMVALVIMVVLSSLGAGLMRDQLPRLRMHRAAEQLSSHLAACRGLAISTGRECRVLLVDYDPSPTSAGTESIGEYWSALGDLNLNSETWDILPAEEEGTATDDHVGEGTIVLTEGGKDALRWVSIGDWTEYQTISGPGSGNENAIVFDPRGFVRNPVEDFGDEGYIDIPVLNKYSYVYADGEMLLVRVSRSGMIRIDPSATDPFSDGGVAGTGRASVGDYSEASSGGSGGEEGEGEGGGGSDTGGFGGGGDTGGFGGGPGGGDTGGGGGSDTGGFGGGPGGSDTGGFGSFPD